MLLYAAALLGFALAEAASFLRLAEAYKFLESDSSPRDFVRVALTSDKPVYKPTEEAKITLLHFHFHSKVANFTTSDINDFPQLTVIDMQDQVITTLTAKSRNYEVVEENTVLEYTFKVPENIPGGAYRIRYDGPSAPEELRIFVLNFKNRAFALSVQSNSDVAVPGELLRLKLKLEALTVDPASLSDITLTYSFLDEQSTELKTEMVTLSSIDGYIVSFLVPTTLVGGVVFSATVHSGDYSTMYQRSFADVDYTKVLVKVNAASGKVVAGLPNKFFFKSFDTVLEDNQLQFSGASIVLETPNGEQVLLSGVNSDENGQGSFTINVPDLAAGSIALQLNLAGKPAVKFYFVNFDKKDNFSPLLLAVPSAVYNSDQTIPLTLTSKTHSGAVNVVLHGKTNVLYESVFNVTAGASAISISIDLAGLKIEQGDVLSLQAYIAGKKPVDVPVVISDILPVRPVRPVREIAVDAVALKQKDVKANAARRLQQDNAKEIMVIPVRDDIIILPPPRPIGGNSFSFDGQAVQDITVFVRPKQIIGAKLNLDASYEAATMVSFNVKIDKSCDGCIKGYGNGRVRAIVRVVDTAAFLEIDKSRWNPTLATKVFLDKDLYFRSKVFRNNYKYIDYLFNSATRSNATLQAEGKSLLENLLGSQSERQFFYDPNSLNSFVQSVSNKYTDSLTDFKINLSPYKPAPRIMWDMVRRNVIMNALPEVAATNIESESSQPQTPATPQLDDNVEEQVMPEEIVKDLLLQRVIEVDLNEGTEVSIDLPDRGTTYQVDVALFDDNGHYGHASGVVVARKRINAVLDSPLYIFSNENFALPVTIENNGKKAAILQIVGPNVNRRISLRGGRTTSQILTINKAVLPTYFRIIEDGIVVFERLISPRVIRPGILRLTGKSGMVSIQKPEGSTLAFSETLPSMLIVGGNVLNVCYQNNLVSLILDILVNFNQVPSGCFEQASMTTFPIIVAIKILKLLTPTKAVLELMKELIDKLVRGLNLLLSYECPSGGFEWFGKDPGNVALTAYGLWQFREINSLNISNVRVSDDVIQRTLAFLERNREGNCSFIQSGSGYDEFANPDSSVAFPFIRSVMVYSNPLLYLSQLQCSIELYNKFKAGQVTLSSYILGLLSLTFSYAGPNYHSLVCEIAAVLANRQDAATGKITNGVTTITRSSGVALDVETSALAMISMLDCDPNLYASQTNKILGYLLSVFNNAYFGSTQGTILSLLAIAKFIAANPMGTGGNIVFDVLVNNSKQAELTIASAQDFSGACVDLTTHLRAIETPSLPLNVVVKPQTSSLTDAPSKFLFVISLKYYSLLPTSAAGSPLNMVVSKTTSGDGLTQTFRVSITNTKKDNLGMILYELNKPSCFDFNINDLELLRDSGKVDFYEIRDFNSKIVFYWRGLPPLGVANFSLSLYKRFANTSCASQPHQAYLYYDQSGSARYRLP